MADWRKQLQPASFRGVPFYIVDDGDAEFGRRAFSVEYPFRDQPFVDDMGRRLRRYSVEAFIIDNGEGDDLYAQRNNLIDALEKFGPGPLVHPRLGALWVQVDTARWRSRARTNTESISISFLEANEEAQPQVAVDTQNEITVTANRIADAQASGFERALSIKNQAEFVVNAAKDSINNGMQGVRDLVRIGTATADSVSSLTRTIDEAVNDIGELILMPRTLAGTVSTLVYQALGIDNSIDSALSGYRAIGSLWGDVEPVPRTTPSRIAQANNQTAIQNLFTVSATVAAARIVAQQASAIGVTSNSNSPFDSADHAYAVRDELVSALDAIALDAEPALYNTVTELQAAIVAHIEAHGNALPRVTRVQFNAPLPMLAIAHRINGNIDLEADLLARNKIKHPLFVPAGRELEVLNG